MNLPVSTWFRVQGHSLDTNFRYDQRTLSKMTDEYIYSLKLVLEPQNIRLTLRYLNHLDTHCIIYIKIPKFRHFQIWDFLQNIVREHVNGHEVSPFLPYLIVLELEKGEDTNYDFISAQRGHIKNNNNK